MEPDGRERLKPLKPIGSRYGAYKTRPVCPPKLHGSGWEQVNSAPSLWQRSYRLIWS